jgi:hypothetical protein
LEVLAFDSKEYRRERDIGGVRQTLFYSPLGVGVKVDDIPELFKKYTEVCEEKEKNHAVLEKCHIYSSNFLSKIYDPQRCTSFLESIIYGIQEFISEVFFSYVIISPNITPHIIVGGKYCATSQIPTLDFFKQLNPMFSYITAWNYFQTERNNKPLVLLDAFSSKNTEAWNYLENKHDLKIYPHGDECNLPISLADIIAYVTDRRLNRLHLRLEPDNIESIWEKYDFQIETRIIRQNDLKSIAYYNYDDVDWTKFQARPILFLDLEAINMQTMTGLDPYKLAIKYVSKRGGSIQGFDENLDSKRLKDGDIFVFAGEEPRKRAETYKDIYDIETHSVKELRRLVLEK